MELRNNRVVLFSLNPKNGAKGMMRNLCPHTHLRFEEIDKLILIYHVA